MKKVLDIQGLNCAYLYRLDRKTGSQMLYRTMKSTGDKLSILGFGAMRLPEKRGRIDEERATRLIRSAMDKGVNYVDTAFLYHGGSSESFLGRALADGYREKVNLATKLPHWMAKNQEDMDRLLQIQLDRLQTDHIDYYLIHNLNGKGWQQAKERGVIDFLENAKADGRIGHMGFSFHGALPAFKTIVNEHDWKFCQIQYNFLDEENQAGTEGLEYAAAKGLGIIIMEPLRGGNLASPIPKPVQAIWDEAEPRRSPVEWALRWVWNRPEVSLVLSGMNAESQVEEDCRIAGEAHPDSLNKEELILVGLARNAYRKLMKAECTGCRYCLPCPSDVNIPLCFEYYNAAHLFGNPRRTRLLYTAIVGNAMGSQSGLASQCTDCGKCVKVCPQQLAIPELLKEVAKEFEGLLTRPMIWMGRRLMAVKRWRTMRRR